ncbi:DUF2303 family protein [Xanthomonas sp. WHRI 1810A]|uniref:DUF2303 family protein n=1 Tax=Xanthomonas sp. WHRI 1810A TaxID=3161565 RepID=UPI0032E87DA6
MPTVVLAQSARVIDLEKYQALCSRFRGTYSTHSLADFGIYVNDPATDAARGFSNQDDMSCVLLFNLGDTATPGHADDRAVLKVKASAVTRQHKQSVAGHFRRKT